MSSKSTSSNRQSSPRAMPVETIITRFKAAQQKKKLHEMDRSVTKGTELLRSPIKPRMKRKAQTPVKNDQKCNSITSDIEGEVQKKKRKTRSKVMKKVEEVKEFCPLKLKRPIVMNKISLKPKHELKVIAQTNKRKRNIPQKDYFRQDYLDLSMDGESSELSRDRSFNGMKYNLDPEEEEKTVVEMIQLIEESGSFGDEDLLEILTCPSPVWWEDPPDGCNEDALFTRPRSTAEMYPIVRTQLQGERKRSSTPNVLSRRENIDSKRVTTVDNVTNKDKEELSNSNKNNNNNNRDKNRISEVLNSVDKTDINNVGSKDTDILNSSNNIDVGMRLSGCDEKFIKKRSKLELLLGNLKGRNVKNKDAIGIMKTNENSNGRAIENSESNDSHSKVSDVNDISTNKVAVMKNICPNGEEKGSEEVKDDLDNLKSNIDKESKASVSEGTRSEISDDENLTDISFQDDGFLNDLENMDIPMRQNPEIPKQESKTEDPKKIFFDTLNDDSKPDFAVPNSDLLVQTDKIKSATDHSKLIGPFNKCNGIRLSFDATHSDKGSSVIEDFLELKLIEDDESLLVNNEDNEFHKSKLDKVGTKPFKCGEDCKQSDKNLATSVIKFKNCDDTRINVLKFESVVPKKLPPLINPAVRKGNTGCVPENLPPLKRNPGLIKVNLDSAKVMQNTSFFDTSGSCSSSLMQDMESISDTSVCFLNEDKEVSDNMKNGENSNDFDVSGVIKWRRVINANELRSNDPNLTRENEISIKNPNVKENSNYSKNKLFNEQERLYNDIKQMNNNEFKDLEFQSLTITKVNNSSFCKLKMDDMESVNIKKNDVGLKNNDEMKESGEKNDDLITFSPESGVENDFNKSDHNKIGTIARNGSETLTIYKIVSDSSGNEESENDSLKKPTNVEPNKALQDKLNSKQSNYDNKSEDEIVRSDNNKDKMVFYYKKWKNNYWKANERNKIEDKQVGNDSKEANTVNKVDENTKTENVKDNVNSIKIASTAQTGRKRKEIPELELKKKKSKTSSKKLKNAVTNKETNINNFGSSQMRYCMKCSSIFDTPQCSYCYRRISTDNKNEIATDYLERCFVCDVCGYKVLSKDSLERHILLRHVFK